MSFRITCLSALTALAACASQQNPQTTTVAYRMVDAPPPTEVSERHDVYVAWLDPRGDQPMQKVGALAYDPDEELASIDVRSELARYDIVVTAEPSAEVRLPSASVVSRTRCDFTESDETPCEVIR